MKNWKKKLLITVISLFVLAVLAVGWYLIKALPIGTGFTAKYLCSSTFISNRNPNVVFEQDIAPVNPLFANITWEINFKEKSVTASAFGIVKSKAIYRHGCGSTLIAGISEAELRKQTFYKIPQRNITADSLWSDAADLKQNAEKLNVDVNKLENAIDDAFAENDPQRPRYTRAVLVIYKDKLIAERYDKDINAQMLQLGWSMSKSITNALTGVLVNKGLLDIYKPAPVPEWKDEDDPRHKITTDQLLRMSSGLAFEEVYAPLKDVTDMLYGSYDFAAFAAAKPLETPPDTKWYYSSGTANIIARIIRQTIEKSEKDYYEFLYREFFDKIGMYSALLEPDPSGTFVGSSYAFATPRDWGRFGLLYLHDGVWNGERILPEGWVKYTTTPTPKASRRQYGAHFWLNRGDKSNPQNRRWPDVPNDAYAAMGFQDQQVVIIPSMDCVCVRFGATSSGNWSTNDFVKSVLEALPE